MRSKAFEKSKKLIRMCLPLVKVRVQMGEPRVESIKEALGGRRSFQTAKLAGVNLSLDVVN